jgi:peptidyl-prolyl cis-trans isomerase D
MSRFRFRAVALVATLALSACAGIKDALTAHVDQVARAGSQELSTTRLAQLMTSAQVPPRKDVATAIANLWLNYQLLGEAAAKSDSLSAPKDIDDAMWAQIAQIKSKKFYDLMAKNFPHADSASFEKRYNDGEMLAARHILFMADAKTLKPAQMDSVRRVAEGVRKQVTADNFATMAQKYGQDGTKARGGDLGVFGKGQMVPDFEKGVIALKPGEVSGLVQSPFGYHIIKRETWAEARAAFSAKFDSVATMAAESTFLANIEKNAKVEVKPGAAKIVKALAEDVDGYRNDNTVLATSSGGNLTAARLARWVAAFPPQARIREQIGQAPDSAMPYFVKNVMRNELVLHAADSARITLDTAEVGGMRKAFTASVMGTFAALQIAPSQLKDSAKTQSEREHLASARIEAYLDKLLKNQAQFVDVSEPVALALRKQYDGRVYPAGIERAVTLATKLKAQDDSAKAKAMPPTAVPMPGAGAPPATDPSAGKAPPPAPSTKKP